MPFRSIAGTDERYALISFDSEGRERPEEDGGTLSSRFLAEGEELPSDVFIFCHGWKGDVPAAKDQYDRWFRAMAGLPADRDAAAGRAGGFRPLWIGVHWPSLPWGDEELGGAASFAANAAEALVDAYVDRLGDRPGLREPLRVIVQHARVDAGAPVLPRPVELAYRQVDALLGDLHALGVGAPPGEDREPFDPASSYAAFRMNSPSFGGGGFGGLLAPLRQLSFWRMKQRARIVGASGMHDLLNTLRARSGDRARFHLMGHSFGCIVASAMITGPANGAPTQPVNSLVLVQGALSHWSYCARIPYAPFGPGYFHRILDQELVSGPIVTTRSRYDRAVGTFYPVGAGAAGQIDFAPTKPTAYGALGAFGAQGLGAAVADGPMLGADAAYDFRSHRVHNLEASDFIRKCSGMSGAHSDIDGPEVAHAVWQAALTA